MASDSARYGRSRMQPLQSPTAASDVAGRRSYTLQYPGRHKQYSSRSAAAAAAAAAAMGMPSAPSHRARHYSGMEYASDTEALHSPASVSSVRLSRAIGRSSASASASSAGFIARSSSLPRTFQREALLRHPELSMEMDRLAQATDPAALLSGLSTDDQLSDSGAVSAPESVVTARKRGTMGKCPTLLVTSRY